MKIRLAFALAILLAGSWVVSITLLKQPKHVTAPVPSKNSEANLALEKHTSNLQAPVILKGEEPKIVAEKPNQSLPLPAPAKPSFGHNDKPAEAALVSPQSAPGDKPPLVDPDARVALALVGRDAEAEDYWFSAINDPSLPPSERQDLIEDLNEVGLSNPQHPSQADLPVILSRMIILEEIEPLDRVNADAMAEAYKDLANLALLASGTGGKPVD